MKVKELIEILSRMPEDSRVIKVFAYKPKEKIFRSATADSDEAMKGQFEVVEEDVKYLQQWPNIFDIQMRPENKEKEHVVYLF
jgi:hypothetical protein